MIELIFYSNMGTMFVSGMVGFASSNQGSGFKVCAFFSVIWWATLLLGLAYLNPLPQLGSSNSAALAFLMGLILNGFAFWVGHLISPPLEEPETQSAS